MRAAQRSAVAGRCGGESKFSKVHDGFPPPRGQVVLLIILDGLGRGRGREGGTKANLAAITLKYIT